MTTTVSMVTPFPTMSHNVTWSMINRNTTIIHYSILALGCSGTTSLLSILGAICIIWTFCKIPEIRNFTRKLMLCLTLADLLSALGKVYPCCYMFHPTNPESIIGLLIVRSSFCPSEIIRTYYVTSLVFDKSKRGCWRP